MHPAILVMARCETASFDTPVHRHGGVRRWRRASYGVIGEGACGIIL